MVVNAGEIVYRLKVEMLKPIKCEIRANAAFGNRLEERSQIIWLTEHGGILKTLASSVSLIIAESQANF
jgi:hypothetical protein